jgi:type III restriction enzyme
MAFRKLRYQTDALTALQGFFSQAYTLRSTAHGIATAFRNTTARQQRGEGGRGVGYNIAAQANYNAAAFGEQVPWVCLRLPTGAGKTYLAARSIGIATEEWLDKKYPLAIWFTPSNMILTQTLEALQNPDHPYRLALKEQFGEDVDVITLTDLPRISPADWGTKAVVLVSTMQAFKIEYELRDKRNVYADNEAYELQFMDLTPKAAQADYGLNLVVQVTIDKAKNEFAKWQAEDFAVRGQHPYLGLTESDIGRIVNSPINVLRRQKPMVIVDEAHNLQSDIGQALLTDLNASCIIEMTATPTDKMNVLFHVSAQALKSEDMIKLPVVLKEHKTNWEETVHGAVVKRAELEELARGEADYVRPIMLLQAEANREGDEHCVTVEKLKAHLMTAHQIPAEQIAIATGDIRELEGHVLAEKACPIRFVITVQALREGWDCPFAYVLCSVQNLRSNTAIQQLLGRVLRMPYAKARLNPELNKAYAFVVSEHFVTAVGDLVKLLTEKMGFNRMEANQFFAPPPTQLFDDSSGLPLFANQSLKLPAVDVVVSNPPDLTQIPEEERTRISVSKVEGKTIVTLHGAVSTEVQAAVVKAAGNKSAKEAATQRIEIQNVTVSQLTVPALQGIPFASLPRLCVMHQGELTLIEPDSLAQMVSWNIAADSTYADLPAFTQQADKVVILDMENGKLSAAAAESVQNNLELSGGMVSEGSLIAFLESRLHQDDILPTQMAVYLGRVIDKLKERGFSMTDLVRYCYGLAKAIEQRIKDLRMDAIKQGANGILFGGNSEAVTASFEYGFTFKPNAYPVKNLYQGAWRFVKHYYGQQIDDMNDEEVECAKVLDSHSKVKYWVRNLVDEHFGYWLPTAEGGRMYPDFVCQLQNEVIVLIEYKGGHIVTADEARAKKRIGELWQRCSAGKGLFVMPTVSKYDVQGRGIHQQIDEAIGAHVA